MLKAADQGSSRRERPGVALSAAPKHGADSSCVQVGTGTPFSINTVRARPHALVVHQHHSSRPGVPSSTIVTTPNG